MYISRKLSIRIAFGSLFLFVAISLIVVRWNNPSNPQTNTTSTNPSTLEPPSGPKITLDNFHRSETKGERKLWQVNAEKGELYPLESKAVVEKAVLQLFQEDGTIIQVQAPKAELAISGTTLSKAVLSGGVILRQGEEYTVETSSATIDRVAGTVTSPTETLIRTKGFEIRGGQLEVEIESRIMNLKNRVSTIVKGKKNA
jgi:LPS export ABC transporter protein LptC